MRKRRLACLLTVAVLVNLFPLPALAAEAGSDTRACAPITRNTAMKSAAMRRP